MEGRVELLDEVKAGDIPRRCRPSYAPVTAVGVDLLVLFKAELEALLLRALGRAPGAFAGGVEDLCRVDKVNRSLLELHGVTASLHCHVDELLGESHVAVVVDADFGDHCDVVGNLPNHLPTRHVLPCWRRFRHKSSFRERVPDRIGVDIFDD